MTMRTPLALVMFAAMILAGPVTLAQTEPGATPDPASATSESQDTVTAGMLAWVKRPVLAEDGSQAVDAENAPKWELTPVSDANIVPGDRILYRVSLENPESGALRNFSFESGCTRPPATKLSSQP